MAATECGAACLAMVLSYFGRYTRVADLRQVLDPGRDGLTAKNLKDIATQEGLETRAVRAEFDALKSLDLPAILHWDFGHYVVLVGVGRDYLRILDPKVGPRRVSVADARRSFTGIALSFSPSSTLEKRGRPPLSQTAWGRYLKIVGGVEGLRATLFVVLATTGLLQVLALVLPLLTKVVVDHVLPEAPGQLVFVGAAASFVVVGNGLVSYARSLVILRLRARLDLRLLDRFMVHMLQLPYIFFQRRASGDLLMRVASNSVIREFLTTRTVSVVFDAVLVLGYLLILAVWSLHFAVLTLVLGTLQVVTLIVALPRIHALTQQELELRAEERSYLIEVLEGIGFVKSAGFEKEVLTRWRRLFQDELNVSVKREFIDSVVSAVTSFVSLLAPVLLLWFGASAVLSGSLELGTMLALTSIGGMLLSPIGSLVRSARHLQETGAHLERIADVLDERVESEQFGADELPDLTDAISLDGVSYRYSANTDWVIRDIDLSISPGEHLAIAGRTGSGKSTLAGVLCGLYQPAKGVVRVGQADRSSFRVEQYRQHFGVVPQDPTLIGGSVRDNILMGRDFPEHQVVAAAMLAEIHEDIMCLPMQYETLVGEGGDSISGGQRQRIAIARAVIGQPSILVFDEATSSLDPVTERRIHENLGRLDCSRVVISHRLSTLAHADRVVALESGRIAFEGAPDAVLDGMESLLSRKPGSV